MRIAVSCGHTLKGAGSGAVYNYFNESEIVRAVGYELIDILERKGHIAYNCTIDKASSQNDYLKKSVAMVNNSDCDLAISLHCNASANHKGQGIEVYTWNGYKHKEAVNIISQYEKSGFRNRGIKKGNHLFFLKKTNPRAMLIELFFLDNNQDRKLYNKLGHKQLARLIYYGLTSK